MNLENAIRLTCIIIRNIKAENGRNGTENVIDECTKNAVDGVIHSF